ncbi:FAD-dependent oxidoreductase [Dactylosporangium fulvum]|uniref:FAD-dependent oxidoreductase n=1 Tax=Dactylosporangium fulvum TaxID=53359 RepID=A0ABY5W937_9ACTN|nr:FAD-dependent oxidoreductase [Dactylosporangium fulvum]UWP86538.1 FAD-dependent oxidoreductase [Dactylosporangium fulvum]
MNKPSCVIIGASAAGVATAVELRKRGYAGAVTLVDADPNIPYERPPLSKTLLGTGSRGLVPIQPAHTYRDLDIELRLGERATAVDPAALTVHLSGGEVLPAGRVVLATGLSPRRLQVAGADAENVLSLRDASDASRIAEGLASGGPLVLIGAGFIGLELAAVAREGGIDVTVVEAQAQPLNNAVGPDVACLLTQLHRRHGVKLLTSATVAEFAGSAGRVEEVRLTDGRRLPASTVVVGVGVEPRNELTVSARIEVDSYGIPVNEFGQTSRAWVYATGDVASQPHPELARRGRIEHWDAAQRHGTAVGATIAGAPARYREAPYAWSDQYGATLQIVGRPRPDDDLVLREGASPSEFLAFWIRDGYVGAVAGMEASRDVGVVKRLMAARVPVDRAELAGRDLDLRGLLKQHRNGVRATAGSKLAG